ncbi:hypothetical protein D3C72_424130 [compost metagenome]
MPALKMPPPMAPAAAEPPLPPLPATRPLVMTRPSRVTVLPEVTSTTRVLYWPSRVTSATPSLFRSPSTVMFLLISSSEVS